MTEGITLRRAGPGTLDALRPLWLELHHHHQLVGGDRLRPYVSDGDSWDARRRLYERYLDGDGFVVVAARHDTLIGYAMVQVRAANEAEFDDTWKVGDRVAEVATLSVAPSARGEGGGSALLDFVDEQLAAVGIRDVSIAALVDNTAAIRLYQRRGFRPTVVLMTRFESAT